jgi:hypothetical protein
MKALEETLQKLQDAAQEVGLIIKKPTKEVIKISVGDYCFERVSYFPYLNSVVSHNNKMTEDMSQRTE